MHSKIISIFYRGVIIQDESGVDLIRDKRKLIHQWFASLPRQLSANTTAKKVPA